LMFTSGSASALVTALKTGRRPVVIDWGFPTQCLSVVAALKAAGVQIWWFDGDREAARQAFTRRGTVSVQALAVQMAGIEKAWPRIQAVIGPHVIETVSAGPRFVEPGSIFTLMFGPAA
jgi:hypothetical protein